MVYWILKFFAKKLTRIEAGTFEYCESLTSVIIPDRVTDICSSAFRSCAGLTSVTIPDTVTYITYDAFADCSDSLEIHGKAGSEAEKYANENEIKFTAD